VTPQDRRQVEALLRAVDLVVPTRLGGMHPNLLYLFDMAQAMRNYMSGDPAPPGADESEAA
jgi:hypothetical protein